MKEIFKKTITTRRWLYKGWNTEVVEDYYNEDDFDMDDVVKISKGATKQDELFDYGESLDYL